MAAASPSTGKGSSTAASATAAASSSLFRGTIWAKSVKIKGEWMISLNRQNNLEFTVSTRSASSSASGDGGKAKEVEVFRALAETARDRDIFSIVVGALARKRLEKKEAKSMSGNLVALDITVLDHPTSGGGRSSGSPSTAKEYVCVCVYELMCEFVCWMKLNTFSRLAILTVAKQYLLAFGVLLPMIFSFFHHFFL